MLDQPADVMNSTDPRAWTAAWPAAVPGSAFFDQSGLIDWSFTTLRHLSVSA
jgi:hypothetical protein